MTSKNRPKYEYLYRKNDILSVSFLLLGPRGTGKSSWLAHHFSDALWFDLLLPDTFSRLKADPNRLKTMIDGYPDTKVVVIDEVQKIPELLDVVHYLIEKNKQIQFILTGSSARKLKRAGVNLLAGRAVMAHFYPFLASEISDRFNLDSALELGLLPLIVSSKTPEKTLRTYVGLYLKHEVQEEALVRNVGMFSRFLEVISFSHGGVLNLSNIARECGVGEKTVEGYLGVLEDLLLGFRLPVFTKRATRATTVRPKFYFFDTGVFRSLRPSGPMDRSSEIDGQALEGLVAQHLRHWVLENDRHSLYFWRTKAGSEVDFIVYGDSQFVAIEVKNATTIHPKDLRSLKTFKSDYPECTPILLYRGTYREKMGDVWCIPADEFLLGIDPKVAITTATQKN